MLVIAGTTFALLVLGSLAGPRTAFLAVMLIRPSCDRLFNEWKDLIGSQVGPGFAFNALVIVLAGRALLRRPGASLSIPVLGSLAFLLVAFAASVSAPDPVVSLRLLLMLTTYWAVLAAAYTAVQIDPGDASRIVQVVIASAVLPALTGLFELVQNPRILLGDDRLFGTFSHPNSFAFYLVTVLAAILIALSPTSIPRPRIWRPALLAFAAVLLALLVATKTRSAWGGLLLLVLVQALLIDRRWLPLPLALPALLLVPGVSDRFVDLLGSNTNDAYAQLNSYAWRQLLWADTLRWLADNPPGLLGHGLDHYVQYVPLFFERGLDSQGLGAHNTFLQIWLEAGALGIVGFAIAIATALAGMIMKQRVDTKSALIVIALIFAYLSFAYSDNVLDYLQFQWPFWLLIGGISSFSLREGSIHRTRSRWADAAGP